MDIFTHATFIFLKKRRCTAAARVCVTFLRGKLRGLVKSSANFTCGLDCGGGAEAN